MRTHVFRRLTAPAVAVVVSIGSLLGSLPAEAAKTPLSISIVGNHFVNGSGHTIRLLGVNHPSAEYGCVEGYGYDDGHFDDADAAAIASWGADAVRIPLNEDCWLGINGQPNSDEGATPPLTQGGYRSEITRYVAALNRHGVYAILDLHWSAPGTQVALEGQPMPDYNHSPAFWKSVASTFKNNHAVVFDLYNEPFDPTDAWPGEDLSGADKVSWNCWATGTRSGRAGGAACSTTAYDENNATTTTYRVAGMQTLVNAVRRAGATQPVLLGGLDWANDLGDHGQAWLTHAPHDPLNQEAVSFHNYMDAPCAAKTCWNTAIVGVAKHVPVVTGEFDETNFLEPRCGRKTPSTFDERYMDWADAHGVSYLAWGWTVTTPTQRDADGCHAFYLIANYTKYTPAAPNGTAVHSHLRALKAPN
jgi:hypothetical protein